MVFNSEIEERTISNADTINWKDFSMEIDQRDFSFEFFHAFKSEIDWRSLVAHTYMTTEFAQEFHEYIGCKSWWEHGKIHRKDGPAMLWPSGTEKWFYKGRKHRKDGPAITYSTGGEVWYLDGRCHRDGNLPAYTHADGYKQWRYRGMFITEAPKVTPTERHQYGGF